MRFLPAVSSLAVLALATDARADERADEALWSAELQTGYGVSIGGGAGMSTMRRSPVVLQLTGSVAVVEEPRVLGWGGIIAELGDRTAAGGVAGARIEPRWHGMRIGAGMVYIASPYTLWGPTFSVGACKHTSSPLAFCADVQTTVYVGGNDLPDDKAAAQIQLVIGLAIDG